jgi:hypothetical protein
MPPRGKRKYTLGDITDLLSEMLLAEKYILIVRKTSFTVRPTNEEVGPGRRMPCRLDDLKNRGKTEWLLVVLPLTTLKARDLVPEIKKMMGPLGKVGVLEKANELLLADTVGSLRRIHQKVNEMKVREAEKKGGKRG